MSVFLQLAFLIAVILLAAKAAGYLSVRLGQPSVLGELLVGILLGPSLLDLLHLPFIEGEKLGETIKELGELGVLLLMFIAGLELHLNELTRNTKVSALAGIMGVVTPVLLGTGAGLLFHFGWEAALFLGLTLGATSVSISAQTLMELKVLRTRVGLGLLGAAVFDDVLIILLLSIFLAIVSGGTSVIGILLILLRMVIFLVASVAFWTVCVAQACSYHQESAHQPGCALAGNDHLIILRRGRGSGRRDGRYHRLVPGRADVCSL